MAESWGRRLKRWFNPAHLRYTVFVLVLSFSFLGTLGSIVLPQAVRLFWP